MGCLVRLFLFIGVARPPAFRKLCSVSPPGLIILVWFVTRPGRRERVILLLLWAAALILAIVWPVKSQTQWRGVLRAPTGRTAIVIPDEYESGWPEELGQGSFSLEMSLQHCCLDCEIQPWSTLSGPMTTRGLNRPGKFWIPWKNTR